MAGGMDKWSRAKSLRHRKFLLGHNSVFLALAVQPISRGTPADRINHWTLDSGAIDRCADRLRGLGGMAQLGRRTVAHFHAMAVQLRGQ